MKTYYIEKKDKHRLTICKLKIEKDNINIYANLEKEKNLKRILNKLINTDVSNVVLSKNLCENRSFINALNAHGIKIFDGRWLEKYLVFEILDYIINQVEIKKEETEIAITTNEITDISIEIIKTLSKQYKRLTIVTNHIEKLRKIEKEIYDRDGVLIVISNNQRKSLLKPQIILNLDFNRDVLNKYRINENAIIINLEGNIKIDSKRFNGVNINDYEIEIGKEETIWRENMESFRNKDLLEANLYMKDTFQNIRDKIAINKVYIKEIFGINGKIERIS